MFGAEFHLVLVAAPEREQGDATGRRILQLYAKLHFLLVKTGEVVAARELDGRMKRRERLHEHLAFNVPAPGAPRHLRQQLEGPFAGAEIRLMQRQVGVNDAHQRHVREMQPLGDHLRADQDVYLADAEIAQRLPVIVLALHRVGVHAPDARVGEQFRQGVLDLLRAEAGVADGRVFALFVRTGGRDFFLVAADVAGQFLIRPMVRERQAAIGALGDEAAQRALQ